MVQGQLVDGVLPSRISGGPWLYVRESHSTDVSLRQHSTICIYNVPSNMASLTAYRAYL